MLKRLQLCLLTLMDRTKLGEMKCLMRPVLEEWKTHLGGRSCALEISVDLKAQALEPGSLVDAPSTTLQPQQVIYHPPTRP